LGPRHRKDHEEFQNIQILPTIDEIQSDHTEYLPRSNSSTWHKPGVQGLLDRHFRLLREDTVGQLRDAAKVELNNMQNVPMQNLPARLRGARTYAYHNVTLASAEFEENKGLQCVLAFDQPPAVKGQDEARRSQWWMESKRLAPESLVVLRGSSGLAIFLTVATPTLFTRPKKSQIGPIEERFSRWKHPDYAHVVVHLVNTAGNGIEDMLSRFRQASARASSGVTFSLLEFPGVLLPAFDYTLKALQHMSVQSDFPFAELLITPVDQQGAMVIDPPAYAKREGFRFDLSAITLDKQTLHLDPQNLPSAADVCDNTHLDTAQAGAVIASLSRSLALIQGPPGMARATLELRS